MSHYLSTWTELITYYLFTNPLSIKDFSPNICVINFVSLLIIIENSIPDTLLEGKWEVGSHPQDPPHTPDNHAWISVKPGKFSRNHILCQVQVDTSKLMADK